MINERLQGVLNWFKENPNSNPNMYELVEVLSQASRDEEKNEALIKELTKLEVERLINNGIVTSEDDCLVQMVLEVYEQVLGGQQISEEKENYLKMVAGVSFYLKTLEANGQEVTYNNTYEYSTLMDHKYELMERGEEISDTVLKNEDLITLRYKNNIESYSYERDKSAIQISPFLPIDEKIDNALELIKPYVYPERLQILSEICHKNKTLPTDMTLTVIRDLGIGVNFDTAEKELDDANLSGLGWSIEMGTIANTAKNGPEFYIHTMEKNGFKITPENMEYLNKLKEENLELEKKNTEPAKHHL